MNTVKAVCRCEWCGDDADYLDYHDREWGVPTFEATALFERLCLEGMQAGLSWLTVLRKRKRMRELFHGFDPQALARAADAELETWLGDAGIIRHRGKLQMLRSNAQSFLALEDPARYLWRWVDGAPVQNRWETPARVPSVTAQSKAMAKELKKAGFVFVGPTICYAFMQSVGMVNDHLIRCFRHGELAGTS